MILYLPNKKKRKKKEKLKYNIQCRWAFQVALGVKNPPANARDMRDRFDPWVRKIPWRNAKQPTPAFLPGESHGQRSLAGYSRQGCKESDTTEMTQHSMDHPCAKK